MQDMVCHSYENYWCFECLDFHFWLRHKHIFLVGENMNKQAKAEVVPSSSLVKVEAEVEVEVEVGVGVVRVGMQLFPIM